MFLHLYISFLFFFFLYNKKNVSSLSLCIHVACVNKQMGRERKKRSLKESIARMCIKKKRTKRHEHTYTLNATQNRETDRKKKENRRCRRS